jgi:hypothetical protein
VAPQAVTPAELAHRATELSQDGTDVDGAVTAIIREASDDRILIEAARDQVAARIRAAVDDYEATATLTLLNRTLSKMPRYDPLDWRVRWAQHRKP